MRSAWLRHVGHRQREALAVERAAVACAGREPSWSAMSAITRSFAVAVVQSTGTPAGSSSSTRTMRR